MLLSLSVFKVLCSFFRELRLTELIEQGRHDDVKELLPRVRNVEFTDRNHVFTPLQLAALTGQCWLAEILIYKCADVNTRGFRSAQSTPLEIAATHGHLDIVQLLINTGETSRRGTEDALRAAVYHGQLSVFTELLAHSGALKLRSPDGSTLLHIAAAGSWRDDSIYTASERAKIKSQDHVEIARQLLRLGLEVNAWDERLRTPLHVAVQRGNMELLTTLILHGANVRALTEAGQNLLHAAAENRALTLEDIEVIFQTSKVMGDLMNKRDYFGYTPMHVAIQANNKRAIYRLLIHGASCLDVPHLRTKKYRNFCCPLHPVHMACILGNFKALLALREVAKVENIWFVHHGWIMGLYTSRVEKMSSVDLTLFSMCVNVFRDPPWILTTDKVELLAKQDQHQRMMAHLAKKHSPNINGYLPVIEQTLLHLAIHHCWFEVVRSLCQNPHLNVDVVNGDGKTALQLCLRLEMDHTSSFVIHTSTYMAEELVKRGADVNVTVDCPDLTVMVRAISLAGVKLTGLVFLAGDKTPEDDICLVLMNRLDSFGASRNTCKIVSLLLRADLRLNSLYQYFVDPDTISPRLPNKLFSLLRERQSFVFSLKQQTRKAIRRLLHHCRQIDELPVPEYLKMYLRMSESELLGPLR